MKNTTISEPARSTPVLLTTDVIVAGGGTAGLAAALASARNGASTVLVERYGYLGGIALGKGTENEIGAETKKYADKVLLHYGGGSVKKSGLLDRIKKSLLSVGIEAVELGGVKPNPRLSLVYEGISICRNHNIKFILAVGGGSFPKNTFTELWC